MGVRVYGLPISLPAASEVRVIKGYRPIQSLRGDEIECLAVYYTDRGVSRGVEEKFFKSGLHEVALFY
jgi:hypothetical protein